MKGNIMLKTKKLLPRKLAANQVVVNMQEAVTNVISANLNVLYVTRDQGRKVWVALGTTAGTLAAQNLRLLKTTVAAAKDKSVAAWDAVEQALDERVMPVLDKVGLAAPAQFGVDLLGKGVHRVSAQVVELTRVRKVAARRPVRKPVAKKVVAKRSARSPRSAVRLAA
jgi:hypothetical protein